MRNCYFIGIAICLAAVVLCGLFLPASKIWVIYPVIGVAFVLLLLLLRSVILPVNTASHGMELIKAQDFNNRLTKVGEREADKIVNLFNTMIDRLRNERLRNMEQESFLKLLIEASPMGVVMLDFDGKVSMTNDSFLKITGIPDASHALGKEIAGLPTDLAEKMAEVPMGKNRIIRRGDIRMYRCYHLNFLQTGFQRPFYLLESLTEEVMKAERSAYEKVIRTLSHEVNNTMGGVRSVLETLQMINQDEEINEVIESCENRCSQMCSFISAYADVVKVPLPVLKEVDLNKELANMIPFLRGMLAERISLHFLPSDDLLKASMDVSLMQQVIVNIVKNAAESIDDEGWVKIKTERREGKPVIEISNNGAPITEEVSRQLFAPFFTTKKEGRGIGLTLISEILNNHSATFSLRTLPGSAPVTTFSIRFPN